MRISEKFTVNAPVQKVWDFLMNFEALSGCIPGCEEVLQIDEKNFKIRVNVKVGPISGRFLIDAKILEMEPPRRVTSECKGEDKGLASMIKQKNLLDLEELSEGQTSVSYTSEVALYGKLGGLGHHVIQGKAKQMGAEFAQSIKSRLEN